VKAQIPPTSCRPPLNDTVNNQGLEVQRSGGASRDGAADDAAARDAGPVLAVNGARKRLGRSPRSWNENPRRCEGLADARTKAEQRRQRESFYVNKR
jgi:hypothetical protein